ncbi:MAG: DUF4974 domain-containing protein [Bacteroidales bacterium]|nr:DUF4974 domain-containing protein [Bacteroidales bacterium]
MANKLSMQKNTDLKQKIHLDSSPKINENSITPFSKFVKVLTKKRVASFIIPVLLLSVSIAVAGATLSYVFDLNDIFNNDADANSTKKQVHKLHDNVIQPIVAIKDSVVKIDLEMESNYIEYTETKNAKELSIIKHKQLKDDDVKKDNHKITASANTPNTIENTGQNKTSPLISKQLQFSNTPLSQVVLDIKRVYGKEIRFKNKHLENCLLNADINELDFEDVLTMFTTVYDLDYYEQDGMFYLDGEACN